MNVTRSALLTATLLAVSLAGCGTGDDEVAGEPGDPRADEALFVPLFDGNTLAGWEGDDALWRVEEGVIVGDSTGEGVDSHEFLATEESFGDFELRLEFRLVDGEGNSGVQFWSKRQDDSPQMEGYQADLGVKYWGCLYDEARRDAMLAPSPRELRRVLKQDDWNEYRIRAEGDRIRLEINGFETVDYVEPDDAIPRSGRFGLQLHSGPPMRVEFRRIRVLRLEAE